MLIGGDLLAPCGVVSLLAVERHSGLSTWQELGLEQHVGEPCVELGLELESVSFLVLVDPVLCPQEFVLPSDKRLLSEEYKFPS